MSIWSDRWAAIEAAWEADQAERRALFAGAAWCGHAGCIPWDPGPGVPLPHLRCCACERCVPFGLSDVPRLPALPKRRDMGWYWTYFVQRLDWVKIGRTGRIYERMLTIRRGWVVAPAAMDESAPLQLVATLPGDWEADLHQAYAEHWAAGEWFHAQPVLARLAELAERSARLGREVWWWP